MSANIVFNNQVYFCVKQFRKKNFMKIMVSISFVFCNLEVKNVFLIKLCLLYNNLALFNRSALDLETYSKFHMKNQI